MNSMQSIVNELVNALREELKTYGGILALLDQQQDSVMNRSADGVIGAAQQIQVQMQEVEIARNHRESWRSAAARALGLAHDATFQELLPKLPADYRPLVQALVDENNHLLVRVQQRTRQNHLLLRRSVELMQTFLSSLFPRENTPTYNDRGGVTAGVAPFRPLYEAVG
jgi:flagellar biosynthesis/type III secretory pathway chaperone